jgi:hypothetical protein
VVALLHNLAELIQLPLEVEIQNLCMAKERNEEQEYYSSNTGQGVPVGDS